MSMRYRSAVTAVLAVGDQVAPKVKLFDFSSFSLGMPAALVTAPPFGANTTSLATPPTKSVNVEEKYTCCSDGARKPVLAEPRSSTPSTSL